MSETKTTSKTKKVAPKKTTKTTKTTKTVKTTKKTTAPKAVEKVVKESPSTSMHITIDGKKIECQPGDTVLQVAKRNKVYIPSLCNHPDLAPGASCRLCVVEIEGAPRPMTACDMKVRDGMVVTTSSDQLKKLRSKSLELLFGEHVKHCGECLRSFDCTILRLAKEFEIDTKKYEHRKATPRHYNYGSVMHLEGDKCIECGNCVEACKKQSIGCLKKVYFNQRTHIVPTEENPCVSCGQCATHCPVGAIHASKSTGEVEELLSSKEKKVVFQFAPSVRVAIGEEFGTDPGVVVTGQIIAGLKRIGADWVVDVDLGADMTTYAEAAELVERVKENKNLPMMTSCCPAWVQFIEMNHPELIPNLTTVRSPNMIAGGLIKKIFAQKTNLNPKDIYVVSVMPCTAKKYEIERKEMWHNGIKPVDAVLTTRELAYLFKKRGINLTALEEEEPDSPLGVETGSGSIYGASGGVMEAALRTGYYMLTGKDLENVNIKSARGMDDLKEVEVQIGDLTLRTAVINGMGNIDKLLDIIKSDKHKYHYFEIMTCPGGCIGGGGQPISTDENMRIKRQQAVYTIDEKNHIRLAHQNPVVKEMFEGPLKDKKLYEEIIETKYHKHKPSPIKDNIIPPKI